MDGSGAGGGEEANSDPSRVVCLAAAFFGALPLLLSLHVCGRWLHRLVAFVFAFCSEVTADAAAVYPSPSALLNPFNATNPYL